jgi:Asp-tRNA(Asn)/Glu-tRNA(Gln) amidotransferase A subunit family amidase
MFAQRGTSPLAILEGFRNQDIGLLDYIDQLEVHFNSVEPHVLAFVPEEGRFSRLRKDAQELLSRYPHPSEYPPFFGLIVGVKDIFHTDGFTTFAGSQLPPEAIQGKEAEVVTQLKQLGALVLGKTVTTEFAYFAPGPTRNPHNPEHTPGGSSSGSAAAVAAGLVVLAFGTQTIGSISRPASFCGVVGYKPSFGRLSKEGVIPLSQSLDHVGIFSPDVATVRLFAENLLPGYKLADRPTQKPVLAVPEGPYLKRADPAMQSHFAGLVDKLAQRGYPIKHVEVMPDIDEIIERHNLITAAEAALNHREWYEKYADDYHPKTRELIEKGQVYDSAQLEEAKAGRTSLRDQLMGTMMAEGIDLWVSPSAPGPAPKGLESTGNPVMNLPWTHSGLPTLSLPAGIDKQGLPLGLQVAGVWLGDEILIEYGSQLEKAIP